MPKDYEGVDYDAPVKESQTRAQLAGVSGRDRDQMRKLVTHRLDPKPPSAAEVRRREALESHMATSGTRRTLDAVCFVAYVALGLELVVTLAGQAGFFQMVAWLPAAMRFVPLMLVKFIAPASNLGPVAGDAIALAMYAVAHIVLRAIHLRVTIQRMGL